MEAKRRKKPGPKKGAKYRTYRDEQRIAALATLERLGGNTYLAEQETGIPRETLRAWVTGYRKPGTYHLYLEVREKIADVFEMAIWETLGVARDKLEEASFRDLVRAAERSAICMLLLRGEATCSVGRCTRCTQSPPNALH